MLIHIEDNITRCLIKLKTLDRLNINAIIFIDVYGRLTKEIQESFHYIKVIVGTSITDIANRYSKDHSF
jgi:hypothetical protein